MRRRTATCSAKIARWTLAAEADQILRPGEGGRLVEVVDPPDEPSVAVAPGAEVFEVKIAHRRDRRGAGGVAQLLSRRLPELAPAVERGAHEEERPEAHPLVLGTQVGAHERDLSAQPFLVAARGAVNVLHPPPL